MFTVTLSDIEPPLPVQVIVKILFEVMPGIEVAPLVLFVPDQFPDAIHEVTFEDVQETDIALPLKTDTGPSELFTFMLTTGGNVHDSFSNGLLPKVPQPFMSVQVLEWLLLMQSPQVVHCQFGKQFEFTV